MTLKIKNFESKPEQFVAVEVTEANLQEIAAWSSAKYVEATKNLVTGEVWIKYSFTTESDRSYSVILTFGDWLGRGPTGVYFKTNKPTLDNDFNAKD